MPGPVELAKGSHNSFAQIVVIEEKRSLMLPNVDELCREFVKLSAHYQSNIPDQNKLYMCIKMVPTITFIFETRVALSMGNFTRQYKLIEKVSFFSFFRI